MSRRLQILFLAALLGVLVCLGLAVFALLGTAAAGTYALLAVILLAVGAARARGAQEAAARRAAGRSCTCCTTSQHDPVKVI